MNDPTERRGPNGFFAYGYRARADLRCANTEFWLVVPPRRPLEELPPGGRAASKRRMRERVQRVEELQPHLGSNSPWPRRGVAPLVPMIEHLRYAMRGRVRSTRCASHRTAFSMILSTVASL